VLSCLPVAYKKIAVANRMKSLREKLNKISREFEKFKFIITQDTVPTIVQCYDKRETTSDFFPEVKGRDVEKKEIILLEESRAYWALAH
jgi:ssDNA-specific exonuclease RecJ